jgi:hypothetical protein
MPQLLPFVGSIRITVDAAPALLVDQALADHLKVPLKHLLRRPGITKRDGKPVLPPQHLCSDNRREAALLKEARRQFEVDDYTSTYVYVPPYHKVAVESSYQPTGGHIELRHYSHPEYDFVTLDGVTYRLELKGPAQQAVYDLPPGEFAVVPSDMSTRHAPRRSHIVDYAPGRKIVVMVPSS